MAGSRCMVRVQRGDGSNALQPSLHFTAAYVSKRSYDSNLTMTFPQHSKDLVSLLFTQSLVSQRSAGSCAVLQYLQPHQNSKFVLQDDLCSLLH